MKRFLRETYLTWTERRHNPHASLGVVPRVFGVLARPLSWLYRAGVGVRWGISRPRLIVGNPQQQLAVIASPLVGGVGKSPLVAHLARRAMERGHKPAIVTRGYGAKHPPHRPVAVGTGRTDVDSVGDEAVMFAQQCNVPVTVAHLPENAIAELSNNSDVTLILLDDGVTRRWSGERRVLVFAASDLESPVRYLPDGRWRIPPQFALPADGAAIISESGTSSSEERASQERRLRSWGLRCPVGWYAVTVEGVSAYTDSGELENVNPPHDGPFAFCGLGHPSRFLQTLKEMGLQVAGAHLYPDHYAYSEEGVAALVGEARHAGASWMVTTHKDAVKMQPDWLGCMPLYVVRITLELAHGADMLSVILEPNE